MKRAGYEEGQRLLGSTALVFVFSLYWFLPGCRDESQAASRGHLESAAAERPDDPRTIVGRDDESPSADDEVASLQSAYVLLHTYPDLQSKVRGIVEGLGEARPPVEGLPEVEVVLHGEGGSKTVRGRKVNVVVTDQGADELRALLQYWEEVPSRMRALGIEPPALPNLPERHSVDVIVIGSRGRLEVRGPASDLQTVSVLLDDSNERVVLKAHAFGEPGESALRSVAQAFQDRARAPPTALDLVAANLGARPPPDEVRILAIGKLEEISVGGPSGNASQDVTFRGFLSERASRHPLASFRSAEFQHKKPKVDLDMVLRKITEECK